MALAIYDSYSSFSENEDVFDKEYIREYSIEKRGEPTINNSDSSTVSSSLLHSSSFNSTERADDWRSKLTYYYYLIFTRKNIILFFAVLFTVITATANNILFYKISLPYVNYPFFLVLYSSAFSVPFYWFIVLIILLVPRWKHLITREMMTFAIWKFAVLGFLDAVQSILQFFSDSHVPGATQQLLQQAVIPITMIASILFLKTKYSMGQYIGATVIVLGIFIDIIPAFSDPESDLYAPISWTLIFLFSSLPFALSYLYKEVIFRDVNMSLFYLMAMDSDFQLLFNIVLTPVDAIPKFGSSPNLYSVYENLWYGCLCFMGVNSLPGDDCSGSWVLLVEYAFFNISINLFLLYLLQQESTAFMFLAMTLSVPIANICFSFPIIMGSAATSLSWFDIAALIVIIIGLLLYRFTTKSPPANSSSSSH